MVRTVLIRQPVGWTYDEKGIWRPQSPIELRLAKSDPVEGHIVDADGVPAARQGLTADQRADACDCQR